MKFTVKQEKILQAVRTAAKGTKKNQGGPLQQRALFIQTQGNFVKVTGNRYDIGIEVTVEAEVEEPGNCVVDASKITGIISLMPDADLIFTDADNSLNVSRKSTRMKCLLYNKEEFEPIKKVNPTTEIKIPANIFAKMIQDVAFSSKKLAPSFPLYSSIHIVIRNDSIQMTTLDGCRIARRTETGMDNRAEGECFVDTNDLLQISSLIPRELGDEIVFSISQNEFSITATGLYICGRLIYAKLRPVDVFFNVPAKTSIRFDRDRLTDLANRCVYASKESSISCGMIMDVKNTVSFSVQGSEIKVNEELTALIEGEEITIVVNPSYIQDILKVFPDDGTITIELTDRKGPLFIRSEGYEYLFLPINSATR